MVRVRSPTEINENINLGLNESFGLKSGLSQSRNHYRSNLVNLPIMVNCGLKKMVRINM